MLSAIHFEVFKILNVKFCVLCNCKQYVLYIIILIMQCYVISLIILWGTCIQFYQLFCLNYNGNNI